MIAFVCWLGFCLLPIVSDHKATYEIALPIIGRRLFFFVWDETWFRDNLLPIMHWSNEERERTLKLWHGFVYSYECNAEFYTLQYEVFEELFGIDGAQQHFTNDDDDKRSERDIKEGHARLIALLLLRGILWSDVVTPVNINWIKKFVESSDSHLVSRVLWDIQERLHREEEVRESSSEIWRNVILPILIEGKSDGNHIDYRVFEPIIETIPFLDVAFSEAIRFIVENLSTSVTVDYVHPRLYREMKESSILRDNPDAGFELISYLVSQKYANSQWNMDEVFDCLRILNEAGINRASISQMVDQHIFPCAPQAAKDFNDSLDRNAA